MFQVRGPSPTRVERSSLAGFTGVRLAYELQLDQAGDRVTGSGRKITENGRMIGSPAQTPISVAGTIDGNRLDAHFFRTRRAASDAGKFVLLLDEDGMLRGRFSTNAASPRARSRHIACNDVTLIHGPPG